METTNPILDLRLFSSFYIFLTTQISVSEQLAEFFDAEAGVLQIPVECITGKIFFIRGLKVMLDRDLAELYEVETRVLKQAVRRNIDRFPADFIFELTATELRDWRSQFVTSKGDKMGLRHAPMAFTEQGVAMLSSVLQSRRAIQVNIQIMRAFTGLRRMLFG
ncbi:MAG: ORF6N domain-containing protein [Desulfobacterales bacterium]